MKKIWEFKRIGGKYFGEVEDGQQVQTPYTDVPPIEGVRADGEPLTIDDQIYDPYDRKWVEIINSLDRNRLNNLDSLYLQIEEKAENLAKLNSKLMLNDVELTKENDELKEKADSLAQINSKTMLASIKNSKDIVLIKDQLKPETEGGK
ncbi:hypothetical protein [Enterococcus devriesei]|uniref:hypothetical protein n=1 Tax=Enterococcus devriesei TaxID=319970 RepID=UPI0028E7F8F8|nr:hypothetical protein [Enterococcus devriesei]